MQRKNWPNFSKQLIYKVNQVITSGIINYTYGRYGEKFEKEFSKFVGNKYSVAICNGTAALEVAIRSLKLPKNSEIIVPARSFFSSAACIVNTGNVPIFSDVEIYSQNICLNDVKKKITKKTKAIICVHLAGLPCEMIKLKKFAKQNNLKLIEDCSQAHGASINNKQVGSFGDVSTWSFCNDKIISTLGEGGMISTNKKTIYNFCKKFINHGSNLNVKKTNKFIYNKNSFGTNLRITEIQSIAGLDQLKNLKKIQKIRENMSKNFFRIIMEHKNFFNSFYVSKNIKSAWYKFYFFVRPNIKNFKKLRLKIIKDLNRINIKCSTGSCPEIYLEKAFKTLKNFKFKRLKNCKLLGETSIALEINHTLNANEQKKDLTKLASVLKQNLKNIS